MYPEAVSALSYRLLRSLLPPSLLPSPLTFMLRVVWLCSGLSVVAVGWLAALLALPRCHVQQSGTLQSPRPAHSLWSAAAVGVFAAVLYLCNTRIITRCFSNPMLRENFALPFLWLQVALLLAFVRERDAHVSAAVPHVPAKRSHVLSASMVLSSVAFMLSWQFGSFVFLLQLAALHTCALAGVVTYTTVRAVAACYLAAVAATAGLMLGNRMLLASLLTCAAAATLLALRLLPEARARSPLPSRLFRSLVTVAIATAAKSALAVVMDVRDDDHVFRILRAKLPPFTYQ